MRKLVAFSIFLTLAGCENIGEKVQTLSEDQKKDLGELETELRSVAATVASCKTNDDCKAIGFKPKNACGDFVDYVALSLVANTSGQATLHTPSEDFSFIVSRIQGYGTRVKESFVDSGNPYCLTEAVDAPRSLCIAHQCQVQPLATFVDNDAGK